MARKKKPVHNVIPPEDPMFIGQSLRMIREQRGMTLEQVAKKMRMDKSTIGRLENQFIQRTRMRTLVEYLKVIGATIVATPISYPINVMPHHETKSGEAYIYQPIKTNSIVGGLPKEE
jgi:transcriptional regulator with XRE-family HTH domain